MREIKYRAWDKKAREMYQVNELGVGSASYEQYAVNVYQQPETGFSKFYPGVVLVMQYTGYKDRNETEIYEGDILKYENPKYPNHKPYVIKWSDDDCGFECVNSENFMLPSVWGEMEIIGNIYDNPELLKGVD